MKIALIVGTRPEAIKLAPVYRALEASGRVRPTIVLTGQHGRLIEPLLRFFQLERRYECSAGNVRSDTLQFAGRLRAELRTLFRRAAFDAVLVQGDTTSALVGADTAAESGLSTGHVEAGLRSGNIRSPFPEEINRIAIARHCRWHFAPTARAANRLADEGITGRVVLTGNTVVDATLWCSSMVDIAPDRAAKQREHVVVTAHRRESFGEPMSEIADAVARLAEREREVDFIVTLHPNPHARRPLEARLGGIANIKLVEALPYQAMIALISSAKAILTDSGGLQEEAPSFGVPVVVMRETTERPEGVEAGLAVLAGTDPQRIASAYERLCARPLMADANPYGDGKAALRIADILIADLVRDRARDGSGARTIFPAR